MAMSNNPKEWFRILDLCSGASLDEVKRSYRELAKVWHPDRFAHDPSLLRKSQEKMKQLNHAYDQLCTLAKQYGENSGNRAGNPAHDGSTKSDDRQTRSPSDPPPERPQVTPPIASMSGGGDASVHLTWSPVYGASSYNVKRSTVSGGPYTTIAPNVPAANYTDNTAANGTEYFYVVSALNAFGESADSAQVSATPAPPPNQIGVVISQLFGGNGGAYANDYIELFNPTAGTVNITGYSLQYGSATGQFGSVGSNIYTFPATTTIGPGRYLTVKFGTPSTGAPVTADITVAGGLNMSGSSGKVAMAINGTALGCGATATQLR